MNDANDRAIRNATKYFDGMLKEGGKGCRAVLITNDVDNQVRFELRCDSIRNCYGAA
jgi:hypothetical protein